MFDRAKIKKIFFISENRKAVVFDDRALICDEKNQMVKEWKGKSIDLLKIKNQPYVAFVQRIIDPPRDPRARRNAVTGENLFLKGHTELMHIDKLEEPYIIHYALSKMVFIKDQFVGLSGQRIIVSDLKKMQNYFANRLGLTKNFIALNQSYIISLSDYTIEENILRVSENAVVPTYNLHLHLSQVCALPNDRFLAQNKYRDLMVFSISNPGQPELKKKNPIKLFFEEFLLLPNSQIVLARDWYQNLHLIDSETLRILKIDTKIKEPILELNVSENNRIIAVLQSGKFICLDEIILKYSQIYDILRDETTQPTVLIDMILSYAGDYNYFFTDSKPEESSIFSNKI